MPKAKVRKLEFIMSLKFGRYKDMSIPAIFYFSTLLSRHLSDEPKIGENRPNLHVNET